MLARKWRNENLVTLLVGMKIDAATVENSMEFPQKTKKIELSHDPAVTLLGIFLNKTKH